MTDKTFTIETLQRALKLIKDIGPAPFFASSKRFPTDHALRFKHNNRDYVAAHPDFWQRVPLAEAAVSPFQLGAIKIEDLDCGSIHGINTAIDFFEAMTAVVHAQKP